MFKTSAWPLAMLYTAMIVFASLFPFEGWRAQGISPWVFVSAPLPPPYWTWFDVNINVIGYAPLGFLLALGGLRSGLRGWSLPIALVVGAGLSLCMEFLQIYLPRRVPSNLDFVLNAAGVLLGALVAGALEWLGALDRWSVFRERWFGQQPHGGLVLIGLWPLALLFPQVLPFGLGQVLERLDKTLDAWLEGTPFMDWLPLREEPLVPLMPSAEMLCVMLGLLAPCLLGYMLIDHKGRRAIFALVTLVAGLAATGLSSAMAYGPNHAWEWLTLPTQAGMVVMVFLAACALPVPRRWCAVLLILVLMWQLNWLNQAPLNPYFADSLQSWEQGRFMRFYGLGQWLGWVWPYAVLAYVALRLTQRPAQS
ncbi:MAG TPA: VanZ family protein [Comamonas sp.]|uniref:VanZ family protein n=1 Tax=Comamonas halotolerans TaxID=3041496 RepID=UPI0024E0FBEE|nr:VanZ family protein [Comamonas sp. NoAH]